MKGKKMLSIVVSAFLIVGSLAGCSKGDNKEPGTGTEGTADKAPGKKVTVNYWQHSSQARDTMMQNLADEFMKANQSIEVKMEFIPEADYSTKLISALVTNAAPDVMQVQSGMIGRFVKADAIKALDEKILPADTIKNEFIPSTVDALQVNGKFYGLPTDLQTIVLYWNKDLLSSAGLDAEKGPKTWDEMLDWAKKLTKFEGGKMVQSGWGEKGYNPEAQAAIVQYGGKIVDDKGQFVFADDAKSVEAIKFLVDSYKVHKVYDTQFMANWAGFRVGKVAMMLGHPAMLGNLKQTAPDVKLGMGLIPAKSGKNTTIVSSWAYVISKNADSQAATSWVKHLTSEDVEKRWTKQTGELPARKSLLTDSELAKDPALNLLMSSLNDSQVSYMQTAALNKIWSDGYEKLILSDEPIDKVLKQMQTDMNAEISKDLK